MGRRPNPPPYYPEIAADPNVLGDLAEIQREMPNAPETEVWVAAAVQHTCRRLMTDHRYQGDLGKGFPAESVAWVERHGLEPAAVAKALTAACARWGHLGSGPAGHYLPDFSTRHYRLFGSKLRTQRMRASKAGVSPLRNRNTAKDTNRAIYGTRKALEMAIAAHDLEDPVAGPWEPAWETSLKRSVRKTLRAPIPPDPKPEDLNFRVISRHIKCDGKSKAFSGLFRVTFLFPELQRITSTKLLTYCNSFTTYNELNLFSLGGLGGISLIPHPSQYLVSLGIASPPEIRNDQRGTSDLGGGHTMKSDDSQVPTRPSGASDQPKSEPAARADGFLFDGVDPESVRREREAAWVGAFVSMWNSETKGILPRAQKIEVGTKRYQGILLAQKAQGSLDSWRAAIRWLVRQPWACGKGTRRWFATIDYLVRPGNRERFGDLGVHAERVEREEAPLLPLGRDLSHRIGQEIDACVAAVRFLRERVKADADWVARYVARTREVFCDTDTWVRLAQAAWQAEAHQRDLEENGQ